MCARVHGVVVARDAVAAGALALAVVAPRAVRAALQHVQLIWRQNHTLRRLQTPDCLAPIRSTKTNALRRCALYCHGSF